MKREVREKFNGYPPDIRNKLETIRELILAEAKQNDLGVVEEGLKWGEPSYVVKGGSPIRMDWKAKSPDQYAVYFNCNTKLVDTFKQLYEDKFRFEGNRAMVFDKTAPLNKTALRHCIKLALIYHTVKGLPLLGA